MDADSNKKAAFRVDSSYSTGSGHVMRCLALAEALRERGVKPFFICNNSEGNFNRQIEDEGFKLHTINYQGDFNINEDAEQTKSILRKENGVEWLVADSYAIDSRWEKLVRNETRSIMVIDDIANRSHDCDLLLDQNYHQDMERRYDGLLPEQCKKLLGPRYSLIRREFRDAKKKVRDKSARPRRVMISLGGSDMVSATEVALEALLSMNRKDIEVDVVLGSSHRGKKKIKKLCDERSGFNFHLQVRNMAQLMANADIAIGAGGISNWERCCVGLPALLIIIAENQCDQVESLESAGVIRNMGWHYDVGVKDIRTQVEGLIDNHEELKRMSTKGRELVDGRGAENTAKIMLEYKSLLALAVK